MNPILRVFICGLVLSIMSFQTMANTLDIDRAWVLESTSSTPPPFDKASWASVKLPDHWDIRRPDKGGEVWYHANFTLERIEPESWSVFLPRAVQTAAVYINGVAVGSSGKFETPLKPHAMRPYLFPFPSKLLSQGHNTIDIRLAGFPNDNSSLYPVNIGHSEDLERAYKEKYHLQVTASLYCSILMLIMFVFSFIFWLFKRNEWLYLWTSLLALSGAIFCSYWWLYDVPISYQYWKIINYSSVGFYAFFIFLFLSNFFLIKTHTVKQWYFAYQFIAIAIMMQTSEVNLTLVANILKIPDVIIATYLPWAIWRVRHNYDLITIILIIGGLLMGFALAANDLYELMMEPPTSGQLLYFLEPFAAFIVIFWLLVLRHKSILNAYQELSIDLQNRVDEKTQQLTKTHDKLLSFERQKAIDIERERIMLDLHDGLGGYLISALSYTEANLGDKNSLHQTLSFAIQDLRLIIDSIDCDEEDMIVVLAMFRERIEPILQLNDIELTWDVINEPRLVNFSSSQAVQIVRILQEAITNIIKHAKATKIMLKIDQSSIIIIDNGTGLQGNETTKGYGLISMQQRAKRFDATITLTSSEKGVEIELSWLRSKPALII